MSHEGIEVPFHLLSGLLLTSNAPRDESQENSANNGVPRLFPDSHNPFITAILGKDTQIFYQYEEVADPTKPWIKITHAYAEKDGMVNRLSLYYDKMCVLVRIRISRGFGYTNKGSSRINSVLSELDIHPTAKFISGRSNAASWIFREDKRTGKFNFSGKASVGLGNFDPVYSLESATSEQRAQLIEAGLHPKLFYVFEKMRRQKKPLDLYDWSCMFSASLMGYLAAENNKTIEHPTPIFAGLLAISTLSMLEVLNAATANLRPLIQETQAACAIRDPKFILLALSHHLTAGLEDVGDNLKLADQATLNTQNINDRVFRYSSWSPIGFKASLAHVFSRLKPISRLFGL